MDEKMRALTLEDTEKVSGGSVVAPRHDNKEENKEPVVPLLTGPIPVISLNPGPQGSQK